MCEFWSQKQYYYNINSNLDIWIQHFKRLYALKIDFRRLLTRSLFTWLFHMTHLRLNTAQMAPFISKLVKIVTFSYNPNYMLLYDILFSTYEDNIHAGMVYLMIVARFLTLRWWMMTNKCQEKKDVSDSGSIVLEYLHMLITCLRMSEMGTYVF